MTKRILVEGFIEKYPSNTLNHFVTFAVRLEEGVFITQGLWFYRANKRAKYRSLLKRYSPFFSKTEKLTLPHPNISFYISTKTFLRIYRINNNTRLFKLLDGKE